MKQIALIISFIVFSMVLSSSIALSGSSISLDDNHFASKSKKKYDLEIKYKKGMKFERKFKLKVTEESYDEGDETEFEEKNCLKTNITILEVKNDMPQKLKIFFKDILYEGNCLDDVEMRAAKKIVGHWVIVEKYDSTNFKIIEKSEDYPEIECDLIDINGLSKFVFYDAHDFSEVSIPVGESFVFDYDVFLLDEDYIEVVDRLFKQAETSREMKLKLEKVEKEKKIKVAYLKGEVKKKIDIDGLEIDAKFIVTMEIDLTHHQFIKTGFDMALKASADLGYGLFSLTATVKMQVDNDFSKEKQKDEVDK